jgi:ubiquinol-cytochrome c reductase cytochrome b subunit
VSWRTKAFDYLDLRLGVRDLLQKNLTEYLLPRNVNIWYTLGATLLALFAIQFVTGILLLMYYIPETDLAFASVQKIMNEVPYGWMIRLVHAVGANVVILVLLLHMLSALYMGAYKAPREFTWVLGFLLFLISLGMSLTGYLLPWSQLSYWATTVSTESPGSIPWVGESVVHLLRGGPAVGQATLSRFFALHVMGFPFVFGLVVVAHLFCVRRIGVSQPPFGPAYRPQPPSDRFRHEEHPDGIPFFPNYTTKDLMVISFFLTLLAAGVFFAPSLALPRDAFAPANPFSTPVGIKPEWYFLASYQVLRLFPWEIAGLAVQAAAVGFLLLLPFVDRSGERRPARRPVFVVLYVLGILSYVVLTIWGHFS